MKLLIGFMTFFVSYNLLAFDFPFVGNSKRSEEKQSLECTNFSGQWQGSCTYTDSLSTSTSPNEIQFQMFNCDEATINRINQRLNGIKTVIDSDSINTQTMMTSLSWNNQSKKEFLKIKFTAEKTIFKGMNLFSLNGIGTMKVISGKLIVEQKIENGVNNPSVVCEYLRN